jgi:hypothetical protein
MQPPTDKRFFRSVYSTRPEHGRQPRIAHQRDGDAFMEICELLREAGYKFADIIYNFPSSKTVIDLRRFVSSHVIVQVTRPPGDDVASGHRRIVHPSGTNLERIVACALNTYFNELSRAIVSLTPEFAAHLKPGYEERARIQFKLQPNATYQAWKRCGPGKMLAASHPTRTAAYFLRTPPLWEDGPSLILAFGMGSTETYIWARLLRTRYPHFITSESPRFVMAELIPAPVPLHPIDGSFAEQWQAEIILDVDLPLSDQGRTVA